jgi:signal transduction histidine kinase
MRKSAEIAEAPTGNARQMEAIGQLAAGIAHEINTPTQYVSDNVAFLKESWVVVARVVAAAIRMNRELQSGSFSPDTRKELAESVATGKIEYLIREIPQAIEETLEGARQVGRIVRAMNEFAHTPSANKCACDLNHAIESTITVARNVWKYVATMETELDRKMPPVFCLLDQINQVLLNLIVNAAYAVGETIDDSGVLGTIRIATKYSDGWATIVVSDTGTGIPESVRSRIFEPFFTTKPLGRGTGQGLSMAKTVVVGQHGGEIWFESKVGKGTSFFVKLPVSPEGGN